MSSSSSSTHARGTASSRIGKFARPKRVLWTDDAPKTSSGTIMSGSSETLPRAGRSATSRRSATRR